MLDWRRITVGRKEHVVLADTCLSERLHQSQLVNFRVFVKISGIFRSGLSLKYQVVRSSSWSWPSGRRIRQRSLEIELANGHGLLVKSSSNNDMHKNSRWSHQ